MRPESPYLFVHRNRCPACCSGAVLIEIQTPLTCGPISEFIRRYYKVDPKLLGNIAYQLVRCQRCTLLYQSWVGGPEFLAELYGGWINKCKQPAHDPTYQAIMAHPLESRDAHEILTAAAFQGRRVDDLITLDYGMGWAMWGRIAHQLGCQSFGTELSKERLDFAQQCGLQCLSDDEIRPESFDVINTEQVMEHLTNLRTTAVRLAAALRTGGILKISVPSAYGVKAVLRMLRQGDRVPSDEEIMPIQPLEHVNSFTSEALSMLASDLGLRIIQPTVLQRYAFLRVSGTIAPARIKNTAKELIRPFYQWRNPRNLYVWMQKQP